MARTERLYYFIQKYSEGELTRQEQIEFLDLLADHQNTEAEQVLHEEWYNQLGSNRYSNRNFQSLLDKIHHQIRLNESSKLKRLKSWQTLQRIAAILFIPLLLSFLTYFYFQKKQIIPNGSYAEIQCPLGVRTKFLLPDGTSGFLNSGSSLKYPVQFVGGSRSVELTGEAFFDVFHNKEVPFHVYTRNLDIKVLGTTFNVLANENEKTEEIVLQTGKVDVMDKSGKQLAEMSPDDQLIFSMEKQTITKKTVEASQYTSWKEGKLVFRNENMQQVVNRLSRWYNTDVVMEDSILDKYTYHATFIDEPLDEVLKLISITTPVSYTEEKRISDTEGIYVKRKVILRVNKFKINQFR